MALKEDIMRAIAIRDTYPIRLEFDPETLKFLYGLFLWRRPDNVGEFFLVRTVIRNHIVFSVVENGKQAWEGTIFPRLQNAKTYLEENGFRLKGKSNDLEVV